MSDNSFQKGSLFGERTGRIRDLNGFQKGVHKIPDNHYSATDSFLGRIGHDEIEVQAKDIYKKLRETFGYKRKDTTYVCEEGHAFIGTVDFDVNITMSQELNDPTLYALLTEVGSLKKPEMVNNDDFIELFSEYCNTILIRFSKEIDIDDKIDAIEEIPELAKYLDYEPDGSSFSLALTEANVEIEVTAKQLYFYAIEKGELRNLIDGMQNFMDVLSQANVGFEK